jgi:hypothetical protein
MRKRLIVVALATALGLVGLQGVASADSPPPTNGGNGAGQSGQCTGDPDSRPTPCPTDK